MPITTFPVSRSPRRESSHAAASEASEDVTRIFGLIAAVCAGLAHKFDLNVTGLRWVVALVTLFLTGVPLIVYLILWAVVKPQPTGGVIDV